MTRIFLLILLALYFAGCAEIDDSLWPRRDYELDDGKVVSCRFEQITDCGMTLTDCKSGQRYECQTNVKEL